MLPRDALLALLAFLMSSLVPGDSFLLPLLFPVSIKITIHSHHKPAPPRPKPDYHFSSIPVYKEVVVKGSPHFGGAGGHKHSYGDGHKYSTSYGDGHFKVYTEEPYVQKGYGTVPHQPVSHYAELSFTAGNYKDEQHHHHGTKKGTEYIAQEPHYKGTPYGSDEYVKSPETHYVAQAPEGHYKGTTYQTPEGHHKGTSYEVPEGHYKGTSYEAPEGHHKGVAYEGHHKGTNYEAPQGHYKGTQHKIPEEYNQVYGIRKKKVYPMNHSFIKQISGYKVTDYVPNKVQQETYQDNGKGGYVSHVAIPPQIQPGHSYAEIEAAHKVKHAPKAYDSKEYADLGAHHQQDYSDQSDYLDDSLPAYKYPPTRVYTHRSGLVNPSEPTQYAGYGTSFYGDSYAKIAYTPRDWKISIRAAQRH